MIGEAVFEKTIMTSELGWNYGWALHHREEYGVGHDSWAMQPQSHLSEKDNVEGSRTGTPH